MKHSVPSYLILSILLYLQAFGLPCAAADGRQPSVRAALEELDKAIAQEDEYRLRKDRRIRELKQQLSHSFAPIDQYALCKQLFEEYLHYEADSAGYYLKLRKELLPIEGHDGLEEEVTIDLAGVRGVMGMYADALRRLEGIQADSLEQELRMEYYYACRTCYGWMADYAIGLDVKRRYMEMTDRYRDSIMLCASRELDRDIVRAEKAALGGKPDEGIVILERLQGETDDMKILSYLNYTMYEAYLAKGDVDRQIYYLARTALWDMRRMVREYASLHKLALLLYEQGDLNRAYRYLSRSMEDAVACKARLRSLEVTEIYPIIDRAYREQEAHERRVAGGLLIGISVLSVLLIAAVGYLYYWMKKLSAMRRSLSDANCRLQTLNQDLEQTGRIKEVYIARYLDRCVGYLDKLEQYRRSLEKLAMASKTEALFKAIRSDQFLRDERKAFYRDFDKSFLELFPRFIDDFNSLLTDEGKIAVKPGELLTTELRIFALIRLGVTDSNRIAHFLGYSLATVYNYRSKMRNRAAGDKDKFEQEVMEIGA